MAAGDGGSRGGGAFTTVLAVAAVALSVLVVLLAIQNRDLKRELAEAYAHEDRPALSPGDTLEPLRVFDDRGTNHTLDWTSTRRTVVLAYTSTCPACAETRPRWDDLAARLAGRGSVRVVGLQLDRARPGDGAAPGEPPGSRPYPVYGIEREANRAFLDLVPYVPATIVVDARGEVVDARFEILDDASIDAVVAAVEP